jgi:hypothetical protein
MLEPPWTSRDRLICDRPPIGRPQRSGRKGDPPHSAGGRWTVGSRISSSRPAQVRGTVEGNRLDDATGARAAAHERGDVCLLGPTAYAVASDPSLPPLDGQTFYGADGDVARLGGDEAVAIGGTVSSILRTRISCSTCCRISCSSLGPRPHPVLWRRSLD